MHIFSSLFAGTSSRRCGLIVGLVLCPVLCPAGQTKYWEQSDLSDFEKGTLKNLSLRSDGLLKLAPRFQERLDSSSAYLWALGHDSAGNLYAGGGPGAKLYRVPAKGEAKSIVEFDALEIHAIAIDNKDRIFVATSPDGKVYRVTSAGKSEVFYDPKAKYIWAMALNRKGDLFVATGDRGEIHRVTVDGKGAVFFRSEETHARSLSIDASDNLIVGTEPGGLVLRVSKSGEGFVLYQMPKKEVTAIAIARDGTIYASGVGTKLTGVASLLPAAASVTPAPAAPAGTAAPRPAAAPPPPTFAAGGAPGITGGSEVYRISPDGSPRKVWTHAQDIVYALGFDSQDRVLIGTGNKGVIYRLDTDNLYTVLLNASPTQITNFCSGMAGKIYAATGNIGKVYEIGGSLEQEGSIESDVLDASLFSLWGRLTFKGATNGGKLALATRSGNLDRPVKNWSSWSQAITSSEGARSTSPPARFLQWKATLTPDSSGHSPELESVEVAYLPKNVAPRIEAIEITPANYRFPAPSAAVLSSQSLTLPPVGKPAKSTPVLTLDIGTITPAMSLAKGYLGARWSASDENGDTLIYAVHIRGVKESQWKLLKDKIKEKYLSWDSSAFPDGEYRLRITASDLPGNPSPQALSSDMESDQFLIDNTPPRISSLSASRSGAQLNVSWKAADALSVISMAEYSLDGGEWLVAPPVSKLSDSRDLEYEMVLDAAKGEHTIAIRVQDEYDNQATDKVVVNLP